MADWRIFVAGCQQIVKKIVSLIAQVCVQDFSTELEYWGLDDLNLEPCCQHTYYRAKWLLPKQWTKVLNTDSLYLVVTWSIHNNDQQLNNRD